MEGGHRARYPLWSGPLIRHLMSSQRGACCVPICNVIQGTGLRRKSGSGGAVQADWAKPGAQLRGMFTQVSPFPTRQ